MPTLYDDIKEAEKQLNLKQEETEDGENDVGSVREDEPVRRSGGQHEGEQSGEGAVSELGGTGRVGDSEGTPRREGGASSGDARTSQKDSGTSQKDGSASQEDGETLLKEPTNSDWARLRRELREQKAELARLKAEKAAPAVQDVKKDEPKPEVKTEAAKEPNKEENYQAWLEWQIDYGKNTIQEQAKLIKELSDWRAEQTQKTEQERIENAAIEEFTRIEEEYKKTNPDYGNAIDFARQKYLDAAKMFYPDKTERQIEEAIDRQMLTYAAQYSAKGLNPAEELYELAIERFGYVKSEAKPDIQEEKSKQETKQKPNLRIVNENRKRSATPLGSGGQSGSIPVTKEIAADMSLGEFSRLTPEDIANLEAMG